MAVKEHILAAIAWLEKVASEIEEGVEHDAEAVAQRVHGYLHYGPTLGQSPVETAGGDSTEKEFDPEPLAGFVKSAPQLPSDDKAKDPPPIV